VTPRITDHALSALLLTEARVQAAATVERAARWAKAADDVGTASVGLDTLGLWLRIAETRETIERMGK
jgi:hypothetical protein